MVRAANWTGGVLAGVADGLATLLAGVGEGVGVGDPAEFATAATSPFAAPKSICTLICCPSIKSTLLVLSGALGALKSSL